MTRLPRPSEVDLRSLAETARTLLTDTRTAAEVHITDLKAQLDDLWTNAEDFLPIPKPGHLRAQVERTVAEIQSWSALGLRGFCTT